MGTSKFLVLNWRSRDLHDLVVPIEYLIDHPSTAPFMDTIVRRQFRTEIGALGGYDMTETGKIRQLRPG
ncbi:MAG: hypothetical protein ND866_28190 [Pyrinomonadaceae bacterium]|nr:hypothetical protein [Pyrinomonadaceae bacterium]